MTSHDGIHTLADLRFTLGGCSVVPYSRFNPSLFGDDLLSRLYSCCLQSRPTARYGILPESQCGMLDLSRDAITAYWHTRQVALLTVSRDGAEAMRARRGHPPLSAQLGGSTLEDGSEIAGFTYPTLLIGPPVPAPSPVPASVPYSSPRQSSGAAALRAAVPRAAVCAYVFFRPWWGTDEAEVLGMLGLAYLFHTYSLTSIHGQRYPGNSLTAKFVSRYGFRDTGTIPEFLQIRNYHAPGDSDATPAVTLTSCVLNTLSRADFEAYIRHQFTPGCEPAGDPGNSPDQQSVWPSM